jgi:hypothetical protein
MIRIVRSGAAADALAQIEYGEVSESNQSGPMIDFHRDTLDLPSFGWW